MAPPVGFDTEQIRDKARKDLLYLLSVVSKGSHNPLPNLLTHGECPASSWISFIDSIAFPPGLGPREEEPRD